MKITLLKIMLCSLAFIFMSCQDRANDAALAKRVVESIQPMFVDEGDVLIHVYDDNLNVGNDTGLPISTFREAFEISNISPYDMKLKMPLEREIVLKKGSVELSISVFDNGACKIERDYFTFKKLTSKPLRQLLQNGNVLNDKP